MNSRATQSGLTRPFVFLGLGAWFVAAMADVPAAAQEVRIWPTGFVTDARIRLRDVATIGGVDAEKAQELGAVEIRPVPASPAETIVEWSDVREVLTQNGTNPANVRIFGAARCTVRRIVPPSTHKGQGPDRRAERSKPAAATSRPHDRAPSAPAPRVDGPSVPIDSLEYAVRQYLSAQAAAADGNLSIRFGPAARAALWIAGNQFRFRVESRDRNCVGMVALDCEGSLGHGVTVKGESGREPYQAVVSGPQMATVNNAIQVASR